MGTALVLLILIAVVVLIIISMVRDKKNGKSLQCGVDCKHCGGHCYQCDPGVNNQHHSDKGEEKTS